MMKTFISLLGGVAFATAAVAAQSSSESQATAQRPEFDSAAITRGAQAWADHCNRCHNFRSLDELDAELWDVSVTHMRVRANLPGSVARDIKAFLMSNALTKAMQASAPVSKRIASSSYANLQPGDAAHGKEIFMGTCFACHGADGKGALNGVPDFTSENSRLKKPDSVLLTHIINGFQSDGSPMPMPAFGGNPNLTPQDAADALAYLHQAFQKQP